MNKKIIISQSIMWAAAILVVSIVEEKEFAVLLLVILATISLITLRKGNEKKNIDFYKKFILQTKTLSDGGIDLVVPVF